MNKAFTLWTQPVNVRAYLSTEFCGNHILVEGNYRIIAYFHDCGITLVNDNPQSYPINRHE